VLNEVSRHEDVLGSGGITPRILMQGTIWRLSGHLHAPAALPPGERVPSTHRIGGWVGPKAGLEVVAKRKKSYRYHCRESNPSREARRLVTILTELPRGSDLEVVWRKYISHFSMLLCRGRHKSITAAHCRQSTNSSNGPRSCSTILKRVLSN
jgi:hypothetical protein